MGTKVKIAAIPPCIYCDRPAAFFRGVIYKDKNQKPNKTCLAGIDTAYQKRTSFD